MAKGKHAAALFEVINSDKRYDRAKTDAMMKTPKWWSSSTAPAKPAEPRALVEPRAVVDHRAAVDSHAVVDPRTVAEPGTSVGSRETVEMSAALQARGSVSPVMRDGGRPAPVKIKSAIDVDQDNHQIAVKLSYTTAAVAGFALLVAVVMAYVIGKKLHNGPQPAVASPPTSVIQSGPLLDGVLDVGPTRSAIIPAKPVVVPGIVTPANNPATSNPSPVAPPAHVVDDARRIVGLNYVIVQSYPEKAQAIEARDALLKSGVSVTVESTPPTFGRRDWFSVIGTKGFDRIKSREFESYVGQIEVVNSKFASDRSFKAFKPQAFKWK